MWLLLVSLLGLVNCSSITEESTGTSKTKRHGIRVMKLKKGTISKHIFHWVNYGSHLSTCTSSILKNKHQTELHADEQHQIKTKNTGTATADASAESYRTRRPRESPWISLLDMVSPIKVFIKFVCKLPFTFYFYSLIQFFNFRTKIPLCSRKTAIAQTPTPYRPLAVFRDESGNGRCRSNVPKPKAQLTMNSCKGDAASILISHRNKYLPSADEVIHLSSLISSTKLVLYSIYLQP